MQIGVIKNPIRQRRKLLMCQNRWHKKQCKSEYKNALNKYQNLIEILIFTVYYCNWYNKSLYGK